MLSLATLGCMLDAKVKMKSCKKRVKELEFELASSNEELVRISPQMMVAKTICNRAWGYGYTLGL